MPSTRRLLPLGAAIVAFTAVSPGTAQAHPFGPPLTANVVAEGRTVEVSWTGAQDDWLALGEATGAFAQAEQGLTGAEVLVESPQVRDYLLEHVTVSQQGSQCAASWEGIRDLQEDGALVRFDCPEEVAVVDLGVSALTDVNQAYRTVVTAGDQQTLFTAAQPIHPVDLTGTSDTGGPAVLLASSAGALVLAVAAAWALTVRRRPEARA